MREFGWTPTELRMIPQSKIRAILTVLAEETKYNNRPKSKPAMTA